MKRICALLAAAAVGLCLSLASAQEAAEPAAVAEKGAAEQPSAAAGKITFDTPILITDVGQGNTGRLAEALLKRAGDFDYKTESMAKVSDLEGVRTLIVGVGASSKGLGAAGLDADQEYERAEAILQAAKTQGIPVIGVHIGGVPRRGELSDRFNRQVIEGSSVFLAWDGGNEDKFFTRVAEQQNVPLILTSDKRAIGDELTKLLKDGYTPKAAEEKQPE